MFCQNKCWDNKDIVCFPSTFVRAPRLAATTQTGNTSHTHALHEESSFGRIERRILHGTLQITAKEKWRKKKSNHYVAKRKRERPTPDIRQEGYGTRLEQFIVSG